MNQVWEAETDGAMLYVRSGREAIAIVNDDTGRLAGTPADAVLMAAAPDLLASLREAVALVPRGLTDCAGWKCRQQNCHACMSEPVEFDVTGFQALIDRLGNRSSDETEGRE